MTYEDLRHVRIHGFSYDLEGHRSTRRKETTCKT